MPTTKHRVLTIAEAKKVAAEYGAKITIGVDPVDATLWQIAGEGWTEAYEPMGRPALEALLAEKDEINKTPNTDAPEATGDPDVLKDFLRDQLSPQAVAVIVGELYGVVRTRDAKVNGEVAWFAQQLMDMLGGQEGYDAMRKELGL